MDPKELAKKLGAPFSYMDIEWRIQNANEEGTRGRAVPYLRFQAVAQRLDEVVGCLNWKNEYVPGPCGGVVCRISLRVGDEWFSKENGAENTSFEPVKGGLSDAFKRAAVMWNIGRYLYDSPKFWVELNPDTNSFQTPRLPLYMLPEDEYEQYGVVEGESGGSGAADAQQGVTPNPAGQNESSVSQREDDPGRDDAATLKEAEAGEKSVAGKATAEPVGSSRATESSAAAVDAASATSAPVTPETPAATSETTRAAESSEDKASETAQQAPNGETGAGAAAAGNKPAPTTSADFSEKDGLTIEDALGSIPDGLSDEDAKRIRTIIERSWDKPDIRPNMRTYISDRSKAKMPEQGIFFVENILDRLDELDGVNATA